MPQIASGWGDNYNWNCEQLQRQLQRQRQLL